MLQIRLKKLKPPFSSNALTPSAYCIFMLFLIAFLPNKLYSFHSESKTTLTAAVATTCNEKVPLVNGSNFSSVTATIVDDVPSAIPLCVGGVLNEANLIDSDSNNYAFISITGIGCDATVGVKETLVDFPAGTYAGYEVSTANLFPQGSVKASVIISTFLDGVSQESYTAIDASIAANTSLINGNGNIVLGFITGQSFDEVRITYIGLVTGLFSAEVYYAVVEEFCAGPALACNLRSDWVNPDFPLIINGTNTGISGTSCSGCSINNTENILSSDTSDYASLILTAATGTYSSVAVENVLSSYSAETFAGFDIQNPSLIDSEIFSGLTIKTFLNGSPQDTSDSNYLLSINSSLTESTERQIVGFLTTKPFDQIQLEVTNLLGISSTTRIYSAVVQEFCPVILSCDTTYFLTNPDFPVIIDNTHTGINGVCTGCSIDSIENLLNTDTSDFVEITTINGIIATSSLAVRDVLTVYPEGSRVGFTIKDLNAVAEAELYNTLTICTFLDGVPQECRTGNSLLDLNLLYNWIEEAPGVHTFGMNASKSFDEVQLKIGSLATLINRINVYNLTIDTKNAYGEELNCCSDGVSFNCDFDNDGLINGLDLDSDDDGVPDLEEDGGTGIDPLGDEDNDGIFNFQDMDDPAFDGADENNDGIVDAYDSDGDGTPNFIDLESDNDGIPDIIEAGGVDANNDGKIDSLADSDGDGIPDSVDSDEMSCTADANLDGICDDKQIGPDSDGDGIQDISDPDQDGNGLGDTYDPLFNAAIENPDSDNDGIADAFDLDSDNDGIPDLVELGGIDLDGDGRVDQMLTPSTGDIDGDGWADISQANNLVASDFSDPTSDTDGDGIPDHRDLDTDNDGIPDLIESGGVNSLGDGLVETAGNWDVDGDGLSDIYDPNASDGPGGNGVDGDPLILTSADLNGDGKISDPGESMIGGSGSANNINADGDAVPNFQDLDSDNDGILDVREAGGTDIDGNGLLDGLSFGSNGFNNTIDPSEGNDPLIMANTDSNLDTDLRLEYSTGGALNAIADSDGDDVLDFLDVDADNDGIYDNYEAQATTGYIHPVDTDNDADGVDAAYDRDESAFGAATGVPGGLAPVDTDLLHSSPDGLADYLDKDSDNDGIRDRQEAWDNLYDGDSKEDNLNVPCTSGDNDGDGLLDCFDLDDTNPLIIGWEGAPADDDASVPGDNSASTGTPFSAGSTLLFLLPNNDGSDIMEPDFRDTLRNDCSASRVYYAISEQDENISTNFEYNPTTQKHENGASTGIVRATTTCQPIGGYYYYYNPLEPENYLFAIRNSSGSPNTVDMEDLVDYIEIKVEADPSNRWVIENEVEEDGTRAATFVMERDWNVVFKGTASPGSTFDIKFYFQPEELDRLDSITTAVSVNNTNRESLFWFKKPGGLNNVDITTSTVTSMLDITSLDLNGINELLTGVFDGDPGVDVGNGKNYIEFTGLTSFSGGTAATKTTASSLPVKLESFTAKADECGVDLAWTVLSENNFDYYEIQRSIDGSEFKSFAWMEGMGDNQLHHYQFSDQLARSKNYYRLKMVDLDNTFEYSPVVYVETNCIERSPLVLYPNPILKESQKMLNVEFIAETESTRLIIMDVMGGRVLKSIDVQTVPENLTNVTIDISDLPVGTYFLKNINKRIPVRFIVTD